MEKESIDNGVESDGDVVEKDKMLHEKISELIDEICSVSWVDKEKQGEVWNNWVAFVPCA